MGSGIYNAGIPDAPSNGSIYGRQNKAWALAGGGSGGEILLADLTPSGVNNVSLAGISAAYTSLRIMGIVRSDSTAVGAFQISAQFNGDVGANYTMQRIFGNKSTSLSQQSLNQTGAFVAEADSSTTYSNVPTVFEILLSFYSDTNFSKTFFTRFSSVNNTTADSLYVSKGGGYWNSTAAINSIKLILSTGNFAVGSHIKIYGVP